MWVALILARSFLGLIMGLKKTTTAQDKQEVFGIKAGGDNVKKTVVLVFGIKNDKFLGSDRK